MQTHNKLLLNQMNASANQSSVSFFVDPSTGALYSQNIEGETPNNNLVDYNNDNLLLNKTQ